MKKEKTPIVDKIAVLNKLFETYKGNVKDCSANEGIPIQTVRSYLKEIHNIYETERDIYDLSKNLAERIYKDAEDVKAMKMEMLKQGHELIKTILDKIKEKLETSKRLDPRYLAETAGIVNDILKANEGILEPVKQEQATNPVNFIMAQIVDKQLNITKDGEENRKTEHIWDN